MSVLAESGNWKRIAMPCGLAFGSASGRVGTPVASENRTSTGTFFRKCSALLTETADLDGVNVPAASTPFAWFAR